MAIVAHPLICVQPEELKFQCTSSCFVQYDKSFIHVSLYDLKFVRMMGIVKSNDWYNEIMFLFI